MSAAGICRSGSRCTEPATRGRFGPWWCDEHGEQLERVATNLIRSGSKLKSPTAVKKPRKTADQKFSEVLAEAGLG